MKHTTVRMKEVMGYEAKLIEYQAELIEKVMRTDRKINAYN